jgi:aspartate/methionine/tyrosine aminotransferase
MLLNPGTYTASLRELFTRNRDTLARALQDAGLTVFRSDSTYFLMADHAGVSKRLGLLRDGQPNDRAFAEYLVREVGVAAIPPSVFYHNKSHGHSLVRFAFCKKEATMQEAASRLAKLR